MIIVLVELKMFIGINCIVGYDIDWIEKKIEG